MAEEPRNAVVRRSPGAIEKIGTGASSILSGMVSDALAIARSQEASLAEVTFQIGNYKFRSPDYRQILLWAEALKIAPTMVVQRLESTSLDLGGGGGKISFQVNNGAILSAVWDFEVLPLRKFEWIEDLSISEMAFKGSLETPMENLSIRLPRLHRLLVAGIKLKAIDFSNSPGLNTLWCHQNQLAMLDLSNVPGLSVLWCHKNEISKLDLSNVSKLTSLFCDGNRITTLDLSNVPELEALGCSANQLTELDLSNVPELDKLYCHQNQLTELDLSSVPELNTLWCRYNHLTELDLSSVPKLNTLFCDGNRLATLDLSNVPELEALSCSANQLTELDLSNVPELNILWCHQNQLTKLDLSNVPKLTELDCKNNQLMELDLSNVPELNGPDCRSYRLPGIDAVRSWRRYLKYRSYDPSVKIKGIRKFSKPELMRRISEQKPVLYGINLDTMVDWILRESAAT